MNKLLLKKWYLILSFVLSIYLLIVTILGFTPVSETIMDPLNKVAMYILWLFVIELIVLFILAKDFKTFFKEQWISIIAVVSSLSVTMFINAAVGIGSLTGLKALKGIKAAKAIKSIKAVKGVKLLKVTKGAKVAKSYKLGKKAKKARHIANTTVTKKGE